MSAEPMVVAREAAPQRILVLVVVVLVEPQLPSQAEVAVLVDMREKYISLRHRLIATASGRRRTVERPVPVVASAGMVVEGSSLLGSIIEH